MRLLRAIFLLVAAAVAACASCSADSGSGSESNFLPCSTDADCPRGACVNEMCDPGAVPASSTLDASDAAEPHDGASSSGGTGGGTGGTGGAPDAGGADAGEDAATQPDSGASNDASPSIGCGPGPTALYLMVDRSIYMDEPVGTSTTSTWDATTSGITSFLQSPLSTGLDAAIQYFPLPDPCNPATYATAGVPFGALPGNETAITTSISGNDPATQPVVGRPVVEAFQSVMSYSKTSSSSSGDDVAVVIITNGYPAGTCNRDMAEVANIAQAGFTTAPAVRTFVIAIRDTPLLWQYDQVTMAGGTGPAFLISPQDPGEVTAAVTDALVRIVGRACAPCLTAGDCGGGACAFGYCVNPG